jgi:hypothetical protein
VIQGDPHRLYQKMNPSNHIPGIDNLELVVNGPLAQEDRDGVMQLHLTEQIPFARGSHMLLAANERVPTASVMRSIIRMRIRGSARPSRPS